LDITGGGVIDLNSEYGFSSKRLNFPKAAGFQACEGWEGLYDD